eukprot:GHVN01003826.1.p1 GENE.GHVN01003826.1~~GHVN01003826.1.p1  ORF type:complete len:169 (+),score=29.43 GHVN01003826.1:195-701(+)
MPSSRLMFLKTLTSNQQSKLVFTVLGSLTAIRYFYFFGGQGRPGKEVKMVLAHPYQLPTKKIFFNNPAGMVLTRKKKATRNPSTTPPPLATPSPRYITGFTTSLISFFKPRLWFEFACSCVVFALKITAVTFLFGFTLFAVEMVKSSTLSPVTLCIMGGTVFYLYRKI